MARPRFAVTTRCRGDEIRSICDFPSDLWCGPDALTASPRLAVQAGDSTRLPTQASILGVARPGHADAHQVDIPVATNPSDSYNGRPNREAVSVSGSPANSTIDPSITARPTPRDRNASAVPTQ